MNFYENIVTRERVDEEDWQNYAMDMLGIKIEPKGKDGTYTQEQVEFALEFTDWYFSGNWIKKQEDEIYENDYEAIMEDKIYEENLSKKLLEED